MQRFVAVARPVGVVLGVAMSPRAHSRRSVPSCSAHKRLEKCVHTRGVRATASLGQTWEQLSSGRSQEITHAVFLYGSQAVASCDVALHKS